MSKALRRSPAAPACWSALALTPRLGFKNPGIKPLLVRSLCYLLKRPPVLRSFSEVDDGPASIAE